MGDTGGGPRGWTPEEERAALALDAQVDDALRGRAAPAADPVVLWLAAALRPTPTPAPVLVPRTKPAPDLSWRAFRAVAAALAVLLAYHGLSGYVAGEWIAANLGEPFNRHTAFEGALALCAAAGAVAAGAVRRRWAPVSVSAGAPLGLLLAAHGAREVTVFAWGAALHLAQGVLAVVLIVTWWRMSRDRRHPRAQEGV